MKCLSKEGGGGFMVNPSLTFSDDAWYLCQHDRTFHPTNGYWVITPGKAKGILIGGNISCLSLLKGTPYAPSLGEDATTILFLEDDDLYGSKAMQILDQQLEAFILANSSNLNNLVGIIIGRYQLRSEITLEKLRYIFHKNPSLLGIPCIANVDFGHTLPMITLPIGGEGQFIATVDGKVSFYITNY